MKLRFPGKTFVLGEYAVVGGGEGLLAGHGPWFTAEYRPEIPGACPFHPESPAGRYLASHPLAGRLSFSDAHGGRGGFGGSGAEFLAGYFAQHELPRTLAERAASAKAAWAESRLFPGSGADILTQAWGVNFEGDFFFLGVNTASGETEPMESLLGAELSFFHTGRKLKTHEHLAAKPVIPTAALQQLVAQGKAALRSNSLEPFAQAMNEYAVVLKSAGLMAPHTAEALNGLRRAPILAAKGCGAMGADVIAVLHQGADLSPWARENSLAEVARHPV